MKKKIGLLAVVLAAAGLLSAGVAPAQATGAPTLPAGQHLWTLDGNAYGAQLWSLDSTNANATAVGTETRNNDRVYGTAVNPVDGVIFALVQREADIWLATVDLTTGAKTYIATINGDYSSAYSLVITNSGEAFTFKSNMFFSLNLTTGHVTKLSDTSGISSIAYNGLTDTLYGFNYDGTAYTVNRSTGALTADPSHDLTLPAEYSCGGSSSALYVNNIAFDANGNPWIENDGCSGDVLVADFATGIVYYVGTVTDTSQTFYPDGQHWIYVYSIFISGSATGSALPETGSNASVVGSSVGISAALLAAGALALVIARRRTARK